MLESVNIASSSPRDLFTDESETHSSPNSSLRYSKSSLVKSSLANPTTSVLNKTAQNGAKAELSKKDSIETFRKIIDSEKTESEISNKSPSSAESHATSGSSSFFDSVWKTAPNSLKISKRSSNPPEVNQLEEDQNNNECEKIAEEDDANIKEPTIISYRKGSKKLSRSGSGSNSALKMKSHSRSVSLNEGSLQKSMFKSSINDDTYKLNEKSNEIHDGGLDEQLAIAVKSPSFNTKVYSEETVFETKYHYAATSRNKDFHILFKSVLPEEKLIDDFSCALSREILLQGRLYVSDKNVCFNSNILGWITNLIIPFSDIQSFEKTSTAGLFPNGIAVTTNKLSKHYFATFISRDTTFEFLNAIWLNYIQKYGSSSAGEEVNETYKEEFLSSEDNQSNIANAGSAEDSKLENVKVERTDIMGKDQEEHIEKELLEVSNDADSVVRNLSPAHSIASLISDPSEKRRYLSDPYMSYKTILFNNSNGSKVSANGSNYDKDVTKNIFPSDFSTGNEEADASNYIEEEIMSIDEDNVNEEEYSGSDIETDNENDKVISGEEQGQKENNLDYLNDILKTPKRQESEVLDNLPDQSKISYTPTDFLYSPEENKENILIEETILPGRIDEVFNMIFGTDFSFQKEYISGLDGSEITSITPFDFKFGHISKEQVNDDAVLSENLQKDRLQRCYAYTKALNYAIGPRSTVVKLVETIETEKIDFQNGLNIVVRSLTPNVPSGGSFYVSTRYLLANAEDNKTKFKLSYFMTWTGSSWVKSIIESSTDSGQKDSAKILKALIEKRLPIFIKSLSSQDKDSKIKKINQEKKWDGLGSPALFQSKLDTTNLLKSAKKSNLIEEVDSIFTKTEILKENTQVIYILLTCILFVLCLIFLFQIYLYLLLKDTRLQLLSGYSSIFTDTGNFVENGKEIFGLNDNNLKSITQKQLWDWITSKSKNSENINKEDLQAFFEKFSQSQKGENNDNILEKIMTFLQHT